MNRRVKVVKKRVLGSYSEVSRDFGFKDVSRSFERTRLESMKRL